MSSILPSKSSIFRPFSFGYFFVFYFSSNIFKSTPIVLIFDEGILDIISKLFIHKTFSQRTSKKRTNFKNLIEKSSPIQNPSTTLTFLLFENDKVGFKSWIVLCQSSSYHSDLQLFRCNTFHKLNILVNFLVRTYIERARGRARSRQVSKSTWERGIFMVFCYLCLRKCFKF